MPSGLCEACDAINLHPVEVKAKDMKAALENGFKPRYGKAGFEAGLLGLAGADLGFPGLAPDKRQQEQRHAAEVAQFTARIQKMEDGAELSLCSTCAEQMSKYGRKWWQFWK